MHEDVCFLTIARAGELIRTRKLSPVELTDAFLARIEAIDPQLNAYLTVTADLASRRASADYIWAQRQRARLLEEMKPVYAKYDGLITAGAGPAPNLESHKQIGGADKFLRPGMGTLFSVTGAPALAMCCGFSASGLPLGIQIAGRPFEDATVLRIGHAYERATSWRDRRPALRPGASAPHIDPGSEDDIHVTLNDETRVLVEAMARRAGLELPPTQLALLLETAPYGLELVRRIRRDLPWSAGPAAPFKLDS